MVDLSPTAQAVLNAYENSPQTGFCLGEQKALAAALRALADQVVPHEVVPPVLRGNDLHRLAQRQHTRSEILAIAAELESTDA